MRTIQGNVVQEALDRHRRTGENLGKCLMAQGWPDEVSALQELASSLGIRFIDLSEETVDRTAAGEIPSELINRARVIPVALEGDHLVLAMANPFDFQTVEHIEILTGKQVERAICTESDMAAAMQTFYGHSVERMIKHLEKPGHEDAADTTQVGHLREIASEPTVVNLVNLIVVRAIRDRASDIHIEPFDSVVKVKYRIDGILHEMPAPPKHLQDAIISRVKIMADM
ncbi:MAG: Flp pilus assembly complex ATPase component TadA, partial [Candidatus Hydrogenedentes bacterium]|nr:Flp pilus assembly complex ATPase component TadA [Candidatus Hydrogenedentota bacterium]